MSYFNFREFGIVHGKKHKVAIFTERKANIKKKLYIRNQLGKIYKIVPVSVFFE
jgi:hypothetical protein